MFRTIDHMDSLCHNIECPDLIDKVVAKLSNKTTSNVDSPEPVMHFHYAGFTHTGMLRDQNEDAFKIPTDIDADTLGGCSWTYGWEWI